MKEKRQERKQETTQVEQPGQGQADAQPKRSVAPLGDSEEVTPELKPRLNDAQVARMAYWLCSAYESASASAQFMQPIADAIKQTAGEVLKMGNLCDMRYVEGLLKRLIMTVELVSHRHTNHGQTLSALMDALVLLEGCEVLP